jgi:prophage regulatory protein
VAVSARDQFDFRQAAQEGKSVNLLRFSEVSKQTALGRTAIYDLIKVGKFPAPVKVSSASRWIDRDILNWIERLIDARDGSPLNNVK